MALHSSASRLQKRGQACETACSYILELMAKDLSEERIPASVRSESGWMQRGLILEREACVL
jgi:hypothetical protein